MPEDFFRENLWLNSEVASGNGYISLIKQFLGIFMNVDSFIDFFINIGGKISYFLMAVYYA